MEHPAPLEFRLLDLGAVDPHRAQTFVEAVAPFVGRGESPPTLVIARTTDPYASLGFHQSYESEIDPEFVRRTGAPVIRRVTGGGTTWLDASQVFYEFVFPSEGDLPGGPTAFSRLLRPAERLLRSLGLAARLRPPSDLVVGDRKISGNAGGEWEGANIVQGGLLGQADVDAMVGLLRSPHPAFRELLLAEMRTQLTSVSAELGRSVGGEELAEGLLESLRKDEGFALTDGSASAREERRYREEVVPRHQNREWVMIPAGPTDPALPLRRVRIAGSRYLEARSADAGRGVWRFRVVEDGVVLQEFESPSPDDYRGTRDLRPIPP